MVAFRFCRPDDLPYLVRAVNECYLVHDPDRPAFSAEDFQAEIRELDVWPSNCMIASLDRDPVGVSIATKRDHAVLVLRLGIHPDHLRQGYGRHLLTSLGKKLAVLGPPTVVAEVPAEPELSAFLEAVGYQLDCSYSDWLLEEPRTSAVPGDAIIPVAAEELVESGLLGEDLGRSWERQLATLLKRTHQLEGFALASPDAIEAFVLFRRAPHIKGTELVATGSRDASQQGLLQRILLNSCCSADRVPVRVPRLAAGEIDSELLQELGFRRIGQWHRYFSMASSG